MKAWLEWVQERMEGEEVETLCTDLCGQRKLFDFF